MAALDCCRGMPLDIDVVHVVKISPLRFWSGGLCLSRSIGDLDVGKSIVPVPVPYLKQVKPSSADGRLIFASDGVWDALYADASLECCRGMPPDLAAGHVVKEPNVIACDWSKCQTVDHHHQPVTTISAAILDRNEPICLDTMVTN